MTVTGTGVPSRKFKPTFTAPLRVTVNESGEFGSSSKANKTCPIKKGVICHHSVLQTNEKNVK